MSSSTHSNDPVLTVHVMGHHGYSKTLCGQPITTSMLLRRRYADRPLGPTGCRDCLQIVREEDECDAR